MIYSSRVEYLGRGVAYPEKQKYARLFFYFSLTTTKTHKPHTLPPPRPYQKKNIFATRALHWV